MRVRELQNESVPLLVLKGLKRDRRKCSCDSNQDKDNKFTLIFLMSCLDFLEA